MFNPDQVKRLRQQVVAQADLKVFDTHCIGCERITVAEEPGTASEPAMFAGKMYPAEKIFGTPLHPWCLDGVAALTLNLAKPVFRTLQNARVIGPNAVLDGNNALHAPEPVQDRAALTRMAAGTDGGHSGFVFVQDRDTSGRCYFAQRARPRTLKLNAIFFHNLEAANYGSFMFRQLPQMLLDQARFAAADCYIVVDRTPWFYGAIELLNLPAKPVFTVREICGEVFQSISLTAGSDGEGFVSPETLAGFARLLQAVPPAAEPGPENLYVSRSLSTIPRPWYRQMMNEADVEAAFSGCGFTIIHPETLTFRDQIAAFRSARRIAGPSGSGMFNSAFATAGCRILDIESHHNTVRQHAKFYASTRRNYAFLFCELDPEDNFPAHLRRYRVPGPELRAAMDWLQG
jgi:capsular polysaccharide biosynthesis protein